MSPTLHFSLKNDLGELENLSTDVNAFLEGHGASERAVYTANLALEEMITNVIKYGYDDAGEHRIEVRLEAGGGKLTILLEDDGHYFDPTQAPDPAMDTAIEDREVGGLGIYLLRQMLEAMTYKRRGERNVVTMSLGMADPEI